MFDKLPFLLCLVIPAVIVGAVLVALVRHAPEGRETPGIGFETIDRTPKG